MKIYFPEDAYYKGIHKYKKGETYEISNELGEANRWLKRGAVEVIEEAKVEEVVVAKPEEVKIEEVQQEEFVANKRSKKENKKSNKNKD